VQHDRTKELEAWLKVMPAIVGRVKTVYGYVNNHFSGHAPANVRDLQRALKQKVVEPSQLGEQLLLF
jgi:uncharacterized protein YecE (DUF72 family)